MVIDAESLRSALVAWLRWHAPSADERKRVHDLKPECDPLLDAMSRASGAQAVARLADEIEMHADAANMRRRLRDAASAIATSPRDWSLDPRDAWLYGIVVGWDEPALRELAVKHGWSEKTVDKLRECHEANGTARNSDA